MAKAPTIPQSEPATASWSEAQSIEPGEGADPPICSPHQSEGSQRTIAASCPTPPPYKLLRYDEDYSYLKDPTCRTDFWDPIKYIPLSDSEIAYLSIGGELRERYEFIHNPDAGLPPASANGNSQAFTERFLLHGDVHVSENLRFFGQLVTGLEGGRIGGPRPDIDRNAFDAHQAFADFGLPLADENNTLIARIGRQEFAYGTGRLIDVREGPNLRLSFDAARLLVRAGDWQVDGWWGKPVLNQTGVFDDDPNPARSFWGVYTVHPFAALPQGNIDLYYLGYENENAVFAQGAGAELRHSLGARLWGKPMPWEYNVEYVYQFGTFGSGRIDAWTAANALRYNFNESSLKPRVGLRLDAASGDRNPNSDNLQTFNPLFPSGVYFNLLNAVGPLNLIDVHPTCDLSLSDETTFTFDWDFYWRESLNDGAYRLSGSPLRTGTSGGRYLGSSPAATLAWNATRHVTVVASYVHFFPGPYFDANPPNKETDYVTIWLDYKF